MRLFGHPIHPFLVHFPIAFWTTGTVCDGLALFGLEDAWPYAQLLLVAGTACAVPAMIAGIIDLARLEPWAAAVAHSHMLIMGASWTAYLVAAITRVDQWALVPEPSLLSISFSVLGLVTMAVGGWYGGQLVYHHGAGVRVFTNED